MYPQSPPQYQQPNGNQNYDYSHMPQNSYQYQPQEQQPPQNWGNDSSHMANNRNRNPTQDLLTENPFIEKKPAPENLMDDFGSSPQSSQRNVKSQQQMFPNNVQPPSVNPPQNHQPPMQQPKPEMDAQSLALINQMQSYFLKIMQYMDNVDKRITSLEKMTKELQDKTLSAPSSNDVYARKPEIEVVKKSQESIEHDLELARKLQLEFNDEVSKASKPKATPTPAPSSAKKEPSKTTGTVGQCPVCNKMANNIETHIEECLAEAERKESAKPKVGGIYELGKQPPSNAMPTINVGWRAPMPQPPQGQPPYHPYPNMPYFVDPQTGQVGYYSYPPNMPPPSYPGNTQK